MKVHEVAQGSINWYKIRLGMPTASEFHKIVTPTGKLSKQANGFAYRLISESLLQETTESLDKLEWVARGKELEPEAIRLYEFDVDASTEVVGFITNDDVTIGASPDRLVGTDGLLEIKCPAPQTHIGYMIEGFGTDYIPQVQGQLLIAEREWCDRFSYHPQLPPHRQRTERDDDFIKILDQSLKDFLDMKNDMLERIRATGFFAEREQIMLAHEQEYQILDELDLTLDGQEAGTV